MSGVPIAGTLAWSRILVGLADPPATWWVALLAGQPTEEMDAGGLATSLEPAGASYARVSLASGSAAWEDNESGSVSTKVDIDYGTTEEAWGTIEGWALCTADVDGDFWLWGDFSEPFTVAEGAHLVIPAGTIYLSAGSISGKGY